ncbi:MAG: hypothetical protein ACI4QD_02540 [Kiritimatiellia bacterium]
MPPSSKRKDDQEISIKSIYDRLWHCRDLEIEMLWKRLTLLGAIMALTYTGYGIILMKLLDGATSRWMAGNLLAIASCCCGMVFSCLWTVTAKGSKRWYEQYEAALGYFQEVNKPRFEQFEDRGLCLSYLDFSKPEIQQKCSAVDDSLLTTNGGRYSVSKVPIAFGQISLAGWFLLSFTHLAAIFLGKAGIQMLFECFGLKLGGLMILGALLMIAIVCERVKSSFR